MKLKFDSALDYQQEAIAAVCDVFKGQVPRQSLFTVTDGNAEQMSLNFGARGVGNRLTIDKEDLLNNIRQVQQRHNLPQSTNLEGGLNLDIEMETGTGKTYVYLRTLLELNQKYGFSKFIIVVPSIAIKEGVYKTIEITREHFASIYKNVTYDAYIYDRVDRIRDFATANSIQIMIMTIDAFNKTTNVIRNYNDKKFGEELPIDLIKETRPIVIIDEPQSTISSDARVQAVNDLNPLCTIRYSATPIRVENQLYRLNAVDSFAKKLVKGIEVESFATKDDCNEAYLLLKSVDNKKSPITARIEMDVQSKKGIVSRKVVKVKQGDDLYEKSGGRDVYEGYMLRDIYCQPGEEYVDFTGSSDILRLGQPVGTVNEDEIKKQQIRATIEEHLNKEKELNPKGIKVLSLFFIDKVSNYREYDAEGQALKGKYAKWFEEIYREEISKPKYHDLWHSLHNEDDEAELVHDGYFSADKGRKNIPGHWKDTNGSSQADDSTYNLIMKDKERLLSFGCKIRFIFSHSALREGWDNPNVFQICTLNESKSPTKKRQEIGRGLRLCVDQLGRRQYDSNLNILTVMANESYEEFARTLQKEYEDDGISFGGSLPIHNKRERRQAKLNKAVFLSSEFKALWDKIKWKTTYRVEFSTDELLKKCRKAIAEELDIPAPKIIQTKADVSIDQEGVTATGISERAVKAISAASFLPDIVAYLQNETNLTRRTIVELLTGTRQNESGQWEKLDNYGNRLKDFRRNPQVFMEKVAKLLRSAMKSLIVDGIRYQRLGDGEYYCQELFESEELKGYLESNMLESHKGVYDYVVYDSENERKFATAFEENEDILLYAKLPDWFKIGTPLGSYNPDWAVMVNKNGEKKLYFVLETKGNIETDAMRPPEWEKIKCGKAHFQALGDEAVFKPVDDFSNFICNL